MYRDGVGWEDPNTALWVKFFGFKSGQVVGLELAMEGNYAVSGDGGRR